MTTRPLRSKLEANPGSYPTLPPAHLPPLQRLAIDTFGVVDSVVANAGVTEIPGWFDDAEREDGEVQVS